MGNSEEQSRSEAGKAKSISHEMSETVCPSCSRANDSSAMFCEDCGAVLKQPAKCSKCGAVARPHADICEVCGTWLLKGQCMFCYAHVEQDQSFCGECGNPPEGIACPRCGQISIFDFCKSCSIPLSIQAREMVKEAAQDPAFKEIASLFEQLAVVETSSPVTTNGSDLIEGNLASDSQIQDDQALRLKAYRESLSNPAIHKKPKSTPKALFSGKQKESINKLVDEITREKERKRRLQEKLRDVMSSLSGKTFSSQQEARRFFMSIIAGLPEEVARKIIDGGIGWRCNAFGVVHNSPGECAAPSAGGVWLLR